MTDQSPHMPIGQTRRYGFRRLLGGGIDWRIMYAEHGDRFVARIKKKRGAGFKFIAWTAGLLVAALCLYNLNMFGLGIAMSITGIGWFPVELPFAIITIAFIAFVWRAGRSSKFFYRIVIDADRVKITRGMNKTIMDAEKRHVGLFNTKGNPLHQWQIFTNNGAMIVSLYDLKTCNDEIAATIVGFLNSAMNRVRQSKDGQITAGSGDNAVAIAPALASADVTDDDTDLRV